jgi:hypothetical protein
MIFTRSKIIRFATACAAALAASACFAQAINLDIGYPGGNEGLGEGPPSAEFGAAAGQPGFWNSHGLSRVVVPLTDTSGMLTGVTMASDFYDGQFGGGSEFFFEGNTGDYARLLNDADGVGTILQGGGLTVFFSGLAPGFYDIYTYAVNTRGDYVETPVTIPGAIGGATQIVTGPMPGNAFKYLITHSIHRVDIRTGDDLQIQFYQPPNTGAQYINGFQFVPVPELKPIFILAILSLLLLSRQTRTIRLFLRQ